MMDRFTFCVSLEEKPLTIRGILSSINSLIDPLVFVAPVSLLMRELSVKQYDCDAPLPAAKQEEWVLWGNSMKGLEQIEILRTCVPIVVTDSQG